MCIVYIFAISNICIYFYLCMCLKDIYISVIVIYLTTMHHILHFQNNINTNTIYNRI